MACGRFPESDVRSVKIASYSDRSSRLNVTSQRYGFSTPSAAVAAPPPIRHMSAMERAYISVAASDVAALTDDDLFGRLARALPFAVEAVKRKPGYTRSYICDRWPLTCRMHIFIWSFSTPAWGAAQTWSSSTLASYSSSSTSWALHNSNVQASIRSWLRLGPKAFS
jgi:hypothetical protein